MSAADSPPVEVNPGALNLTWSDELVTGHAAMDATHREFVALASDLIAANDGALLEQLRAFERHAQAHFGAEDALMRSTAYPSSACHIDEHAAVLKSVAEVIALVAQGNLAIGRDLADELARWFPAHTHHMDKSLADWLFKLSTGGSPLVLQRGKAAKSSSQHRPVHARGEPNPSARHPDESASMARPRTSGTHDA